MCGGKGKVRGIMKDNLSCDTAGVGRKDGEGRGGRRCEEEAGEKRDNASPLRRKGKSFLWLRLCVAEWVSFFPLSLSLSFFFPEGLVE